MRLARALYRLARTVNTGEALASGKPRRILRRVRSVALGRLLGKAGVWRRLWR